MWERAPGVAPFAGMPSALRAALTRTPNPTRPTLKPRAFTGELSHYAETALERESRSLASCPAGAGRHLRLFAAAAALGELVAGGALPQPLVEDRLRDACSANGMQDEGRNREIERTIAEGIGRGKQSPRAVPAPACDARSGAPWNS